MSASFWAVTLGTGTVLLMMAGMWEVDLPLVASFWAVGVMLIGMIDIWSRKE